ncbi:MAG: PKD domain-containing protein, partial [Planctomycetes bacterium]|nr:PKD domain-containing protein [Planctomycetota bacterium]
YFCPVPEDNIEVMVQFKDQMAELTPIVLGDPEVAREISETESSGRVDILTREVNGQVYIFAAEIRDLETPKVIEDQGTYTWNLSGGNITVRFDVEDLPDGATVQVYDESRSIEAEEGYFEDTFGPLDVHIYVWNTTGNEPPEADAGDDDLVVDSDENGYETVTLDGSGSSDSDGTIASYVWKDGTATISTDETAQVSLSSKRHVITLVVTDDDGATDSDVVVITVNTAPAADAGDNGSATDSDGDGYETLTLDGSDSEDGDGAIATYVWSEGGSPIATGETVDVDLSVGTHTITLTVTDTGGATDSDEVVMTVGAGSSTAVQYQIAASADDTYCTESASSYTSTTMYWPYTTTDRRTFLRWPITIPDGATIVGAYVKVRSTGSSGDWGPSTVRLEVVDSDSCGSFTTNPYSFSVMTGYLDWQLPGTWTSGQWFRSGNIATLVQAFIDRGGYTSGNYLGLRAEWAAGQWKQVYQYNNAPADGAILEVYYTTP